MTLRGGTASGGGGGGGRGGSGVFCKAGAQGERMK
jgi:hypothetical protein